VIVATLLSSLNLVGERVLVTATYFETVKAVTSQSNWRFRTYWTRGSGGPRVVDELLASCQVNGALTQA
jgi:hypothetical protein